MRRSVEKLSICEDIKISNCTIAQHLMSYPQASPADLATILYQLHAISQASSILSQLSTSSDPPSMLLTPGSISHSSDDRTDQENLDISSNKALLAFRSDINMAHFCETLEKMLLQPPVDPSTVIDPSTLFHNLAVSKFAMGEFDSSKDLLSTFFKSKNASPPLINLSAESTAIEICFLLLDVLLRLARGNLPTQWHRDKLKTDCGLIFTW